MIKVGLDIGNSKISCVVCNTKSKEQPTILSFVAMPTNHVNKNIITNFESLKFEVKKVIDLAAKESQTEIKSINLNIPLLDANSVFYNSEIHIENECINDLHLKKSINQSDYFDDSINQYVLMNFIANYEIDNKVIFDNPLGNFAKNSY